MPVPELLLAVAVLFGGLWIYGKSSGLTFFGDDWEFILGRRGISTGTLLIPHNGHLSLAPVVIYKTLFATVGLDDYGPYRAVLVLLHCLAAVLLYVLLRRRTGSWVALAGALVLLFLGSAGETLIYPFTMNFVGAIAFGLAALVALDRGDRVGDVVACAALLVSLSFSGVGLPFVVAALVELSLDRPRRRALWVALIRWSSWRGGPSSTGTEDRAWRTSTSCPATWPSRTLAR